MKFKITKEQILELAKSSCSEQPLKQWFPKAFETKLEVGKWYIEGGIKEQRFLFVKEIEEDIYIGYGIEGFGDWFDNDYYWAANFVPATNSEVEAALINEARRRGFKSNIYIEADWNGWCKVNEEQPYLDSNNHLWMGRSRIFVNGKWATIIPTMTKQEAEEKLNCKIV